MNNEGSKIIFSSLNYKWREHVEDMSDKSSDDMQLW